MVNNKPYFTKYFPTKGRINKEGTNVMFKIGGKWTEPCDFDSFIGPAIQEVAGGVLFLCSKDIKVGDIVDELLNTGEYEKFEIHTPNDVNLERQFKVIGEISPDALSFVKEGDEFEHDELFANGVGLNWSPIHTNYKFQVKCPTCGHFH